MISESLQPQTERSSQPGPEPSSVEADVYIWRYAHPVVHARKEKDQWTESRREFQIVGPNSASCRERARTKNDINAMDLSLFMHCKAFLHSALKKQTSRAKHRS